MPTHDESPDLTKEIAEDLLQGRKQGDMPKLKLGQWRTPNGLQDSHLEEIFNILCKNQDKDTPSKIAAIKEVFPDLSDEDIKKAGKILFDMDRRFPGEK